MSDPYAVQVRLSQRRNAVELALLRTFYPCTPFVHHAVEAGIQAGDFWDAAHRRLFLACLLAHEHGQAAVIQLSIRALEAEGLWTEGPARMGMWSPAKLADLAFGTPAPGLTPQNTRTAARKLIRFSISQCNPRKNLPRVRRPSMAALTCPDLRRDCA